VAQRDIRQVGDDASGRMRGAVRGTGGRATSPYIHLQSDLGPSIGLAYSGAVLYTAGLFVRHYAVYWESAMPKKTAKSLRVKKTNGRRPNGGERLKMTDRDRVPLLAALDSPPKPLPELARRVVA
jgi:hypothetical protein